MKTIIPEIAEIVNFYSPELIEQIARETGFVQRKSKLGGVEFLALMTQGLYAHPDATLNQRRLLQSRKKWLQRTIIY